MSGDRALQIVFLLVALTLPVSALLARRLGGGRTARLALLWVAIFAAAALAATWATGGFHSLT